MCVCVEVFICVCVCVYCHEFDKFIHLHCNKCVYYYHLPNDNFTD